MFFDLIAEKVRVLYKGGRVKCILDETKVAVDRCSTKVSVQKNCCSKM